MVATEASLSTRESWNSLPELQSLLPPLRLAKSSGSIDRYGFMDLLAARCGMRAPRRAFAEWVHGWIWDANPIAEDFGFSKLPRDLSLIVRNEQEKVSLVGDGFTRVVVGGLPFAYVEQQHARRNTHSLLAFPPHSAEAEKVSSGQEQYMDFLESIKRHGDSSW